MESYRAPPAIRLLRLGELLSRELAKESCVGFLLFHVLSSQVGFVSELMLRFMWIPARQHRTVPPKRV